MQPTPIRTQLLADLVEAARQPPSAPAPITINAAPGATVIIHQAPSKSPDTPS